MQHINVYTIKQCTSVHKLVSVIILLTGSSQFYSKQSSLGWLFLNGTDMLQGHEETIFFCVAK